MKIARPILAAVLAAGICLPLAGGAQAALPQVVVLHDTHGPYGHLGEGFSIMVRNLLGHFPVDVTAVPVTQYASVRSISAHTTFYVGSTFDEWGRTAPGSSARAAYEAFVADVARGRRTVWMGHNLARLAWAWDPAWGAPDFRSRFGFDLSGYDETPAYNRVIYKGTELDKGLVRHVSPGADVSACPREAAGHYACDPGLTRTVVTDPTKAVVRAEATSTISGARDPYLLQAGTLWLVGDIPFTYFSEEDRYLALADVLHDMLGIDHAPSRRGLLRLEDVSADSEVSELLAVESVMDRHGVPFGIAAIPFYEDPNGVYNGGRRESRKMSGSAVADVLRRQAAEGASVVQHGTTHQWEGAPNPYNLVSGDDFEFYRVTEQSDFSLTFLGPIYADPRKTTRRIQDGQRELSRAKLTAFAWEAPHYAAGPQDYRALMQIYPNAHWGRVLYFPPSGGYVGQLYPYVVRDIYGQTVLPENLGNISPEVWKGYAASHPEDVIRRASKARVVRDGFASFYFHPYLDPALLDQTLSGIRSLGYTFVRPCSVVVAC